VTIISGDSKMKKIIMGGLLALSGAALAGEYKPFFAVDTSTEKDALAQEYIGANVTVGVKSPDKLEISVKSGVSLNKTADTTANNVELKIKKTYDIGTFFLPWVGFRLGEAIAANTTTFTHYAFETGLKIPLSSGIALDLGYRYRNAFESSSNYRSNRYHATLLYDIDQHNTVGLRYTSSFANSNAQDRDTWRVHYQRSY
jgi:opacity protein-like surface antigen